MECWKLTLELSSLQKTQGKSEESNDEESLSYGGKGVGILNN